MEFLRLFLKTSGAYAESVSIGPELVQNRYVIPAPAFAGETRPRGSGERQSNTTLRTMLCEALRIAEVARYAARVSLVSTLLRLRPQLLIKPLGRRNSAVLEINRPDSGLTQSRTVMLGFNRLTQLRQRRDAHYPNQSMYHQNLYW